MPTQDGSFITISRYYLYPGFIEMHANLGSFIQTKLVFTVNFQLEEKLWPGLAWPGLGPLTWTTMEPTTPEPAVIFDKFSLQFSLLILEL